MEVAQTPPTGSCCERGGGVHCGKNHPGVRACLSSREQSVGRAELRASLWAFEWARGSIEIVTDNEAVVKGMFQIIFFDRCLAGSREDLWRSVHEEI